MQVIRGGTGCVQAAGEAVIGRVKLLVLAGQVHGRLRDCATALLLLQNLYVVGPLDGGELLLGLSIGQAGFVCLSENGNFTPPQLVGLL